MDIGQRKTKQRKMILSVLNDASKPAAIQEIFLDLKKKKQKINITSIYRTLNMMSKATIVNVIDFGDGKKRFELAGNKKHHHHLYCKKCGKIDDIQISENEIMGKIKKRTNFKIENHTLEFFGFCQNCR